MRVPLSGIITGFRIRQTGTSKDKSEYGFLDILQPGDKNYDSTLTHVVVDDMSQIEYFLKYYSDGQLKKIDLLVHQLPDGREKMWLLINIFGMHEEVEILDDNDSERNTNSEHI